MNTINLDEIMKNTIRFLANFLMLLLLLTGLGYSTNVVACGTLVSGDYVLTVELVQSVGDCILLNGHHTTFDLNGHNITGKQGANQVGIRVTAGDVNITNTAGIASSKISNFTTAAIEYDNTVGNGTVQNVSLNTTSQTFGFYVLTTNNISIFNSNIWADGGDTIRIQGGGTIISNSKVMNNTIFNPTSTFGGVVLYWTVNGTIISGNNITTQGADPTSAGVLTARDVNLTTIANNSIRTSGGVGIYAADGKNATIFNNTINSSNVGLKISSDLFGFTPANDVITNNSIWTTYFTGTDVIFSSSSNNNFFYYNNLSGSGGFINNSNSTNFFNTTVGGVAKGNIYENITSYAIYDFNLDGWGDTGPQYPANATNSPGLFSPGSVGTDNGPATTLVPNVLTSCGGITNATSVVYIFKDAINGSAINATAFFNTTSSLGNNNNGFNQFNATNFTISACIYPANASFNVTSYEVVIATGYSPVSTYHNLAISNVSQNVTILLYPLASTTPIQLLVQQYPNIPLGGIQITMYQFTPPNTFTWFTSCTTTSDGTCLIQAIPNSVSYLYNFTALGTNHTFGPQVIACQIGATVCYQNFILNPTSIPYQLSGNVSGACVYSNSSLLLNCSASDLGTTITHYALVISISGSISNVCTNTSIGNTTTLLCHPPNVTGVYPYTFIGYDSSNNPYILSADTLQVGIELATFGASGWVAMLFLFCIIALSAYYNLGLSMAMGIMALLLGAALGFIPIGSNIAGSVTAGIIPVIIGAALIAALLMWRLKV